MSDVPEKPYKRRHTKEEMDAMAHFLRGHGEARQSHEVGPLSVLCPTCGGEAVRELVIENRMTIVPKGFRLVHDDGTSQDTARAVCVACDGKGTVISH
jgi:hypothetical protein